MRPEEANPFPIRELLRTSLSVPFLFLFQDLIKVHFNFLRSIDISMMSGGSGLAKVFLEFKER